MVDLMHLASLRPYELARLLAAPALGYFQTKVRTEIAALARPGDQILDVGGRRSPYTVGLPAKVTVMDLPRESELQKSLELGVDDAVLAQLQRRRSNIERVVLADMTTCPLPSQSFDGVMSIEVIEHVPDDEAFVAQIARVLKPGGWFYMTTPNGDYIPNTNPDHQRHYRRAHLQHLLARHFSEVHVTYGIKCGKAHLRSLRGIDPRRPFSLVGSVVNYYKHRRESFGLEQTWRRTAHLFAVARV